MQGLADLDANINTSFQNLKQKSLIFFPKNSTTGMNHVLGLQENQSFLHVYNFQFLRTAHDLLKA